MRHNLHALWTSSLWPARECCVTKIAKRTVKLPIAHPYIAIFNLAFLSTVGWCSENIVMISLTVQKLLCWQTNKQTSNWPDVQTHKWILLKTIVPWTHGWYSLQQVFNRSEVIQPKVSKHWGNSILKILDAVISQNICNNSKSMSGIFGEADSQIHSSLIYTKFLKEIIRYIHATNYKCHQQECQATSVCPVSWLLQLD